MQRLSSRMKLCFIFILAIIAFYPQVAIIARDLLKTACPEVSRVEKVTRVLRSLVGFPPPKPPWWRPGLCRFVRHVHGQPQGCTDWLIVGPPLLLVVAMTTYNKRNRRRRKKRHTKHPGHMRKVTRMASATHDTSTQPVAVPAIDILTRPVPTLEIESPNTSHYPQAVTTWSDRTAVDGQIYVPHVKGKQREAYERFLLGPVAKSFAALRLLLVARFRDLGIPDSALKWTTKADPSGTPEFMGVCAQGIQVAVVLVPGDGINIQVQRLGRARGQTREVAYQTYRVTYKGFVPGDHDTTLL